MLDFSKVFTWVTSFLSGPERDLSGASFKAFKQYFYIKKRYSGKEIRPFPLVSNHMNNSE